MTGTTVRLTRHHSIAWLLAPAVLLAFPVAGLAVGRLIDGPDELEQVSGETADWSLPLLFVAAVVALFAVCWTAGVLVLRATERRDVRRVVTRPIARWPQYATFDQWTSFVAAERDGSSRRLTWLAPVAAILATGGGLAVGSAFGSAMVGGAVGGFVAAMILAGAAARSTTARRNRALDRHRDRLVGIPNVTVSLKGVLDDDLGVTAFTQLARASHIPLAWLSTAKRRGDTAAKVLPIDRQLAKSGWSFVELTFDQRVTRGLAAGALRLIEPWYARSAGMRWTVLVRVPPDRSAEADAVVAALGDEYRLEPSTME